jgi:hypothetical protein
LMVWGCDGCYFLEPRSSEHDDERRPVGHSAMRPRGSEQAQSGSRRVSGAAPAPAELG